MSRSIAVFLLSCLAFVSSPEPAQAQETPPSAGQRAQAEAALQALERACAGASGQVTSWPAREQFRVQFATFFAQNVDDRLAGELEGDIRRLLTTALVPLGLTAVATGGPEVAVLDVAGLGEALPPESRTPGIYTGASWRGLIALRQSGGCAAAFPFNARLQPPDALASVAFEDPAAVPYMETIETGLIPRVAALVESLRGQVGLSRVALSEADWRVRTAAVERLTDQALLIGVARGAKAPWLRMAAVWKVTNQRRLDEIAQADKDAEVRQAALARLAELARQRQ